MDLNQSVFLDLFTNLMAQQNMFCKHLNFSKNDLHASLSNAENNDYRKMIQELNEDPRKCYNKHKIHLRIGIMTQLICAFLLVRAAIAENGCPAMIVILDVLDLYVWGRQNSMVSSLNALPS